MDLHLVEHVGLVVDGHGHEPDALETAARAWLRDIAGLSPLAARGPWPMAETWWGGDDVGVVQQSHACATAVTVINVPDR